MLLFNSTQVLGVTKRMFLSSNLPLGVRAVSLQTLPCMESTISHWFLQICSHCSKTYLPGKEVKGHIVTFFNCWVGCFREYKIGVFSRHKQKGWESGHNMQQGKFWLDMQNIFLVGVVKHQRLPVELVKSLSLGTFNFSLDKRLKNTIKLGNQFCFELRVGLSNCQRSLQPQLFCDSTIHNPG